MRAANTLNAPRAYGLPDSGSRVIFSQRMPALTSFPLDLDSPRDRRPRIDRPSPLRGTARLHHRHDQQRPPGLTDEERRAWGERLVRENNAVIATDDGMFTLRAIGELDVERR
jgi:hypothetical protein